MRLGVHFAAQDLLRACHGECGDLVAQLLARARDFLLDFGLDRRLFPLAFLTCHQLNLLDHLRRAFFRLAQNFR